MTASSSRGSCRKRRSQGGQQNAETGRRGKDQTCCSSPQHGAAVETSWLQRLPSTLLGRVWPADRVVLGVRVSKGIRRDLLSQAEKVELIAADCGRVNPCLISATLKRFEKSNIGLAWSDNPQTVQLLLKGLAVAALAGCTRTLTHLDLPDNQIGPEATGLLSGVLAACQSLVHLNLNCNEIGAIGAQWLAEVIEDNSSIQSLDLSSNMFNSVGAQTLAKPLAKCTALKRLDVSGNGLGSSGAGYMAEALLKATQLTHLDMRCNCITSAGAESLAGLLCSCPNLLHLNLSRNKLDIAGAQQLAPALSRCRQLTHLKLGHAEAQEAGVSVLASSLAHLPALALLDLQNNFIGDRGLSHLASALSKQASPSLSHLDLSCNQLSPGSAPHLVTLVGHSAKSLRDLHLSENPLGTEGVGVLAPVLGRCGQLKHLALVSTDLTLAGLELLVVELAACQSEPFLQVAGNQFGDVGVRLAHRQ